MKKAICSTRRPLINASFIDYLQVISDRAQLHCCSGKLLLERRKHCIFSVGHGLDYSDVIKIIIKNKSGLNYPTSITNALLMMNTYYYHS